jgi:Leu/Phe-tRNA-protein transferase
METLERIIAKHPFFVGLDDGFTSLMVSCASNMRFKAGQT